MGTTMENNRRGGGDFMVSVTAERDVGIFVAIEVRDENDNTVLDAFTSDPREIENFFYEVDQAKAEWKRMKADE